MDVDYVVTVETKGIPLAYEVAKSLGVQLVIVRRDNKVTEGPTVTINYVIRHKWKNTTNVFIKKINEAI